VETDLTGLNLKEEAPQKAKKEAGGLATAFANILPQNAAGMSKAGKADNATSVPTAVNQCISKAQQRAKREDMVRALCGMKLPSFVSARDVVQSWDHQLLWSCSVVQLYDKTPVAPVNFQRHASAPTAIRKPTSNAQQRAKREDMMRALHGIGFPSFVSA
jgi:hypothetical protein